MRKIFLRAGQLIQAGGTFLWHTSCITFFVARKFHAIGMVRDAAMNLRMAKMQLAGLRIPPRVRTVPVVRRRLPVTMVADSAQPVIIRHRSQNLGSPVGETRATQSPRL